MGAPRSFGRSGGRRPPCHDTLLTGEGRDGPSRPHVCSSGPAPAFPLTPPAREPAARPTDIERGADSG